MLDLRRPKSGLYFALLMLGKSKEQNTAKKERERGRERERGKEKNISTLFQKELVSIMVDIRQEDFDV